MAVGRDLRKVRMDFDLMEEPRVGKIPRVVQHHGARFEGRLN